MIDNITNLSTPPNRLYRILLIPKNNANHSNSNEQYREKHLNTRAASLRAAYDEGQ